MEAYKDGDMCVRYILAHFPETRNNDKLLMVIFWEMFDKIPVPKEFRRAFLQRATTPETITRCRRRVQETGNYEARPEVKEKRQEKSQRLRDFFTKQP